MRSQLGFAAAVVASFVSSVLAAPMVAIPGDIEDVIVTEENTLNGTDIVDPVYRASPLQLRLHNNFGTGGQLYAYVTGLDSNNAPVILTSSGQFYYPNAGGSAQPIPIDADIHLTLNGAGGFKDFTVPDYISSGRIYVSEGKMQFAAVTAGDGRASLVEPSFVNPQDANANLFWGFVEFTNNAGGIYANISFVDFVGLVFSMKLTLGSGETQQVVGLDNNAIPNICAGLQEQTRRDGQPWEQMCMYRTDGTPLRVLAPNMYLSSHAGAMSDYYTSYVNQVWTKYSSEDLLIDTQGEWGVVPCRVQGSDLVCSGDSMTFPKPTTGDIFGCNTGPFANIGDALHKSIVARLCAAFHRSELLLSGGNKTPSLGTPGYFTVDPTTHYSRLVHEHEVDGKGYAFSYDDVNPHGENAAGVVAGAAPQLLEIWAGGM